MLVKRTVVNTVMNTPCDELTDNKKKKLVEKFVEIY